MPLREKIFGRAGARWISPAQKASAFRLVRVINRERRTKGQHGGPITHAYINVLRALISFGNKSGRIFPSYEKLARSDDPNHPAIDATSRSTVARAIKVLEAFGIITWVHCLVREGDAIVRTSNQYVLTVEEFPDRLKEYQKKPTPAAQRINYERRERKRGHVGRDAPDAALISDLKASLGPPAPVPWYIQEARRKAGVTN